MSNNNDKDKLDKFKKGIDEALEESDENYPKYWIKAEVEKQCNKYWDRYIKILTPASILLVISLGIFGIKSFNDINKLQVKIVDLESNALGLKLIARDLEFKAQGIDEQIEMAKENNESAKSNIELVTTIVVRSYKEQDKQFERSKQLSKDSDILSEDREKLSNNIGELIDEYNEIKAKKEQINKLISSLNYLGDTQEVLSKARARQILFLYRQEPKREINIILFGKKDKKETTTDESIENSDKPSSIQEYETKTYSIYLEYEKTPDGKYNLTVKLLSPEGKKGEWKTEDLKVGDKKYCIGDTPFVYQVLTIYRALFVPDMLIIEVSARSDDELNDCTLSKPILTQATNIN